MVPFCTVRQASGTYPVWVGSGLLENLRQRIDQVTPGKRVVLLLAEGIADDWGPVLRAGLGRIEAEIVVPDSETRKNLQTAADVVDGLIRAGVRRDWVAVVAGGGTAGDMGGFAAAIVLRGIAYVHVPTTLLAQVDSSLGGKLGVNHAVGKNLIGVFAPPAAVICDLGTLATLPAREVRSGLYETLKCGVLGDRELFSLMESDSSTLLTGRGPIETVVKRAIAVKARIVSEDEREGDMRRLLNYGHTIGHGFEAAGGFSRLTHGDAVAWGMIAANEIAVRRGMIDDTARERIDRAILKYRPEALGSVGRREVLEAVTHDKKFTSTGMVMVLPTEIGRCVIVEGIEESDLARGLDYSLGVSAAYEARA